MTKSTTYKDYEPVDYTMQKSLKQPMGIMAKPDMLIDLSNPTRQYKRE